MAFILRRGSRGTKAVLILLALFVAEAHAMTRELQSKEDRTPKQAAPANGTDPAGAAASASRGEADAGSAVIGGVIKFLWDWIGPALLSELGSAVANKVKSFLKNRRVDRSCAVVVRDAVQLVNDERMTAISALKRQAGSLHAEVKALGKFKTQVAGLNKQIATLKSQAASAQRSLNSCKAERSRFQGQVSDLKEQVAGLQGEVEDLQAQLEECGGGGPTTTTTTGTCADNGSCSSTTTGTDPTTGTSGDD